LDFFIKYAYNELVEVSFSRTSKLLRISSTVVGDFEKRFRVVFDEVREKAQIVDIGCASPNEDVVVLSRFSLSKYCTKINLLLSNIV
jgi:hypothetical protein